MRTAAQPTVTFPTADYTSSQCYLPLQNRSRQYSELKTAVVIVNRVNNLAKGRVIVIAASRHLHTG